MTENMETNKKQQKTDWVITLVPLCIILILSVLLMCFPERSAQIVGFLRNVFVNDLGFFLYFIRTFYGACSIVRCVF